MCQAYALQSIMMAAAMEASQAEVRHKQCMCRKALHRATFKGPALFTPVVQAARDLVEQLSLVSIPALVLMPGPQCMEGPSFCSFSTQHHIMAGHSWQYRMRWYLTWRLSDVLMQAWIRCEAMPVQLAESAGHLHLLLEILLMIEIGQHRDIASIVASRSQVMLLSVCRCSTGTSCW